LRAPARLQGDRPLLLPRGREGARRLSGVPPGGVRGRAPTAGCASRARASAASRRPLDAGARVIRRAMVLAAGRGTRLAPLTDRIPKPLAPVADRPFLDHLLARLAADGIREVVINLHHLGDQIAAHVGDGGRFGLVVRYSRETHILDTGGG